MGMTATIIGVGVGAALIGGASGAVATHIVQKRIRDKEFEEIQRRINDDYRNSRGVIRRYNRIS